MQLRSLIQLYLAFVALALYSELVHLVFRRRRRRQARLARRRRWRPRSPVVRVKM